MHGLAEPGRRAQRPGDGAIVPPVIRDGAGITIYSSAAGGSVASTGAAVGKGSIHSARKPGRRLPFRFPLLQDAPAASFITATAFAVKYTPLLARLEQQPSQQAGHILKKQLAQR